MRIEERVRIFHDYAGCPGMVFSDETGQLGCTECGQSLGRVEPGVLSQLVDLIESLPA